MNAAPAGEIATLDVNGRVTFPAGVLRRVTWWRGVNVEVLIEARRTGCLRIFALDPLRSHVEALRREADRLSAEQASEVAAVLADRYRPAMLYKERRLQLVKELAPVLALEFGAKAQLYAESHHAWIALLSLEARQSRLDDTARFPGVDASRLLLDG